MIGLTAVPSGDREGDNPDHLADPAGSQSAEVDWDGMLAQLASQPFEEGWVTLEEASNAAGLSRSTLRAWYRSGQIRSKMVAGRHGPQRLVPLDQVVDRALRSARARRQLEHARSLEAEVAELRQRLETIERYLGIG
jgi:transposase